MDNCFVVIKHDSNTSSELADVEISDFTNDFSNILSDIDIYECIKGSCSKTFGYFYYGEDSNINVVQCDLEKCEIIENDTTCDSNNSDKAYYTTTFEFCFKYDYNNIKYTSEVIKYDQTNYIFSLIENSQYYYLYISYKNSRIIGLSILGKLYRIYISNYINIYIFKWFYFYLLIKFFNLLFFSLKLLFKKNKKY